MKKFLLFVMILTVATLGMVFGTTIHVLVWDDVMSQAVQTLIPQFEQTTGINVVFERVPSGNPILTKEAVGVTPTQSSYDLIALDEPFVPKFASAGLILNYNDWPQGNVYKKIDLNSGAILPTVFDAAKFAGNIWGMPINGNLYVWMTNELMLENPTYQKEFKAKYGYDLQVPQNFTQLLDMAKFFHDKGLYGFAPFTLRSEGSAAEAVWMFSSFGTNIIGLENGKYVVTLNKEDAIKAMQYYSQLLQYSPPGANSMGHPERIAAFSSGKVFTMFQWPALIPNSENPNDSMVAGKIAFSVPPAGPAATASVRGCWVLAIPSASQNKAAAAEFAYWWASKDVQQKLASMGMASVREDVLMNPDLIAKYPWYKAMAESMKYAVSRPRFVDYAALSNIIQKYWLAGVTGTMKPEDAVNGMIQEINNLLKTYNG